MLKGQISKYFVKYLPEYQTGRKIKVKLWRIVKTILYKLKTGIQWENLPMRQFFGYTRYSWQSVYYHFNKWAQTGIWEQLYRNFLKDYKSKLDMSVVNYDGSHSPAKRGGESVGYQGRKKSKTSNILILTDKQGVPVGWSKPISGHHNDSFELRKTTSEIFDQMEQIGLNTEGLFMNADAGFDVKDFRKECESRGIIANIDFNKRNGGKNDDYLLDNELYKHRFSVEQLNAWVDGFKTLRVRYETKSKNWLAMHTICFTILFARKFDKSLTFSF